MGRKILWLFLIFTIILSTVAVPVQASNRTALVIGNSSYKSSPLDNPVNDAQDMKKVLLQAGFDVILITNADYREMLLSINKFASKLNRARVGLFFYAGHGMQIKGDNFLIPIKAGITSETDVEYAAVNVGRILGKMESAGNPTNIVILDACRDNPFKRSFRTSKKGLARMDAPVGSIIAYATAPGSVAADGAGRNGTYTNNLIKNISKKGLSLNDIFMEVRKGVLSDTNGKQVPWEESSLTGNFYFTPGKDMPYSKKSKKYIGTQPVKTKSFSSKQPLNMDTLLAQAKASKSKRKAKFEKEKSRKAELKQTIKKYKDLINNYGTRYMEQAWQSICADFPVLTSGLETGNISALETKAGLLPGSGETWIDSVTGMEFVYVPKGCFQMGSNSSDADSDEKPVHKVCVDGFWMGKYEVTQGQYKKIMGSNPSNFFKSGDDYPVETVSWNDAKKFISKLNQQSGKTFKLPAEAQWEYAAKSGGKDQKYSGGNDIDRFAWYRSNSQSKTHRVGTKAPNGLGLYDMSGNVWEWCEDVYDKNAYSKHERNNPLITSGGSSRVGRGGSWYDNPRDVRAANRGMDSADFRDRYVGFRLCFSQVRQ